MKLKMKKRVSHGKGRRVELMISHFVIPYKILDIEMFN
jgi:hypothetical protein